MKKSIIITLIIAVLFMSAGIAGIYYPTWTSLIKPDIIEIISISILFFGALWALCGFVMIYISIISMKYEIARYKSRASTSQSHAKMIDDTNKELINRNKFVELSFNQNLSRLIESKKSENEQKRKAASAKANLTRLSEKYNSAKTRIDDLEKQYIALVTRNSILQSRIKELNTGK